MKRIVSFCELGQMSERFSPLAGRNCILHVLYLVATICALASSFLRNDLEKMQIAGHERKEQKDQEKKNERNRYRAVPLFFHR
jgi:hypothetical protein